MRFLLRILSVAWLGAWARAEVVRVDITGRALFADGKLFGSAGAYERIKGRMYLETDPQNAANERICDLKRALRNAKGKVEGWTDFFC